jgi:hypothetical protein
VQFAYLNRERREKLLDDYHFLALPMELQDVSVRPIQHLFFLSKISMIFYYDSSLFYKSRIKGESRV